MFIRTRVSKIAYFSDYDRLQTTCSSRHLTPRRPSRQTAIAYRIFVKYSHFSFQIESISFLLIKKIRRYYFCVPNNEAWNSKMVTRVPPANCWTKLFRDRTFLFFKVHRVVRCPRNITNCLIFWVSNFEWFQRPEFWNKFYN